MTIKKVLLYNVAVMAVCTVAMFLPVLHTPLFTKVSAVMATLSTLLVAIVYQFDWEYVKSHVSWEVAANSCVTKSGLETMVDTGIERDGQRIIIDIHKAVIEPWRYKWRWTVFHDEKTGVTLYRDEMRLRESWYYAY